MMVSAQFWSLSNRGKHKLNEWHGRKFFFVSKYGYGCDIHSIKLAIIDIYPRLCVSFVHKHHSLSIRQKNTPLLNHEHQHEHTIVFFMRSQLQQWHRCCLCRFFSTSAPLYTYIHIKFVSLLHLNSNLYAKKFFPAAAAATICSLLDVFFLVGCLVAS